MPGNARAQAYQCRVPSGPVILPNVRRDGPVRRVPVGGYTLALSWSPEFCRFREGNARHARQCSGREGRFAFVVHGLWPEGRRGGWPQWCPTDRRPSQTEVRASLCMTPDAGLIAHEWAKHGSCMVRDPDGYLRITRILWNSLRWPDFDRLSRDRDLSASDIRNAFADANRYWEPEMVGLVLNERGWLEEMRLCYDTRFRPARCDARRFGPADAERVRIWRGL
ncbi:ribonuclease T [Aurantiacibacter spongiae]|uniref:Ribonuclease T n=2 Tax=Aurantiacibacter spongiae TaxID=2488860 RepID=A0A3N5CYJ4_9SPHN|nr:ribonuclease T [Aurantiacibacter spongiae]